MSGVCPSGSIDLFLFVSCPLVKSFPLSEVNLRLPTAFSLVARNRSISTLTYWVGLVGGVVFISKKDKFVPSTNDGIVSRGGCES